MGFPHQPSEGVQIPRRQRFRRAQHPVVFRHHVPDPAANPFRGDRLLQPFPIFGIHIGLLLTIPGGLFELALAFWLLIKGFNAQAYGQVRDNQIRDNQIRRAAAPATA